ncbi:DNA dC-_dU-editing enzyme APOBEC-3 isoform X2 [Castor canadensis]|uniref:single-stranded DNA cytosine deaminase n=1 Tax=Castor canadensis TaxID=51338 RepID=A0A8B7VET5_CASCN|nr:DNA dC->dU-editing enzyme APOBEC3-like isoform X2 [Castor canadensis]
MPLQLPGPRTNLRPACQSCLEQSPHIRKRLEKLYKEIFYFNFKNLFYATGRHNTFLCYQVKRTQHGLTNPLDRGVFTKQYYSRTCLHAEQCFLYWFHEHMLDPAEDYQVTWYISWSPCSTCADEMASFLATHRNVSLTIFSARLYYFWNSAYQNGLRKLYQEGAQVKVMTFQEFEDCWENFVYNKGESFMPWKGLSRNNRFLKNELKKILGPMSLLKEDIFLYQFNNQQQVQKPYFRRRTYLCYQLEQPNGSRPQWPAKGCLQNKKGHHAEIRFIKRIHSMGLEQDQDYQITCYITWSPCLACACALAELKNHFPRLTLRIFASRLYFHWIRKFQMGLQHLYKSGVLVAVMSLPEFTDCWEKFVNHRQVFFTPWDKLEEHSRSIQRRLRRILQSWDVDDLTDDFRNLRL